MSLSGPSRTIIVEPLRRPEVLPAPAPDRAPAAPVREPAAPEREPQRAGR